MHIVLIPRPPHTLVTTLRVAPKRANTMRQSSWAGAGQVKGKAQAIPFTLTRADAEKAFHAHHEGTFTSSGFSKVKEVAATFIPFWVGTAELRARVLGGEIGFERMEPTYDFRTRRWNMQRVTEWRSIDQQFEWERRYDPLDAGNTWLFQYGSWKYPKRYLSRVLDTSMISSAVPLKPQMLDDAEMPNGARRVEPFTVRPDIAAENMQQAIQGREQWEADNYIRKTYSADSTRNLMVQIDLGLFRLTPLYVPVYVITSEYMGGEFYTFINGVTGKTAGQNYYAIERVALATGGLGAAFSLFTGAAAGMSMAGWVWSWIAIPALIGGLASRYFPLAKKAVLERWQNFEMARMGAQEQARGSAEWDYEWVGGYRREEQEQRRRYDQDWQYESARGGGQRQQYTRSTGDANDPAGYYKALGVKPSASKEEIQSAFRGLAMKDHPDRFNDPKDKDSAKKRFQKLSEAYGVLRDGKRGSVWLT
jgi:hypothetical protein